MCWCGGGRRTQNSNVISLANSHRTRDARQNRLCAVNTARSGGAPSARSKSHYKFSVGCSWAVRGRAHTGIRQRREYARVCTREIIIRALEMQLWHAGWNGVNINIAQRERERESANRRSCRYGTMVWRVQRRQWRQNNKCHFSHTDAHYLMSNYILKLCATVPNFLIKPFNRAAPDTSARPRYCTPVDGAPMNLRAHKHCAYQRYMLYAV